MEERQDRPIAKLESVRQLQDRMMESFDPTTNGSNSQRHRVAEIEKQRNRERGAKSLLADMVKCRAQPVQVLNQYRQKTKAGLDYAAFDQLANGHFRAQIRYTSVDRNIEADALDKTKKGSKAAASFALLMKLRDATM
jgi:hypothetical protein